MVVLPQQNDHFERERPRDNTLVFPPLGGQSAIGVAQSDHEALKRDTSMRRKWSFYLNRTTTLSASRPRDSTLVFRPLGGQSAIGVAFFVSKLNFNFLIKIKSMWAEPGVFSNICAEVTRVTRGAENYGPTVI